MQVRVHYGAQAGTVLEFPYAVGLGIVESGRGTRVDGDARETGAVVGVDVDRHTAVPALQHGDPPPPVRLGSPRRRDRARA